MSYEISRSIPISKVPEPKTRAGDYKKLLKSIATLQQNEALEVIIEKASTVTAIRKAINKAFTMPYVVQQRQTTQGFKVYIYQKENNNGT